MPHRKTLRQLGRKARSAKQSLAGTLSQAREKVSGDQRPEMDLRTREQLQEARAEAQQEARQDARETFREELRENVREQTRAEELERLRASADEMGREDAQQRGGLVREAGRTFAEGLRGVAAAGRRAGDAIDTERLAEAGEGVAEAQREATGRGGRDRGDRGGGLGDILVGGGERGGGGRGGGRSDRPLAGDDAAAPLVVEGDADITFEGDQSFGDGGDDGDDDRGRRGGMDFEDVLF